MRISGLRTRLNPAALKNARDWLASARRKKDVFKFATGSMAFN